MERIAASRKRSGVTKSGSPTPSEMTPSAPETRSKKRRIPLAGMRSTFAFVSERRVALMRPSASAVPGGWGGRAGGRERVRAEDPPTLPLRTEVFAAGAAIRLEEIGSLDAQAVADAVVAGEVRGGFGRLDDVVDGEAVVGQRE